MGKIRPIGHRRMYLLIWHDKMDGDDAEAILNQRRAHCKVCGESIAKGAGFYWRRYAPGDPNNFRFTVNYLCDECHKAWHKLRFVPVQAVRRGRAVGPVAVRPVPCSWSNERVLSELGLLVEETT